MDLARGEHALAVGIKAQEEALQWALVVHLRYVALPVIDLHACTYL